MNQVLRVFMLAVPSKEIHTDRDYDWRGRLLTRRRTSRTPRPVYSRPRCRAGSIFW
jgi:hypothetical protein